MEKSNTNNSVTDNKSGLPKYLSDRRFCDICTEELGECVGHVQLFNKPLSRSDIRMFHKSNTSNSSGNSSGLDKVKKILGQTNNSF